MMRLSTLIIAFSFCCIIIFSFLNINKTIHRLEQKHTEKGQGQGQGTHRLAGLNPARNNNNQNTEDNENDNEEEEGDEDFNDDPQRPITPVKLPPAKALPSDYWGTYKLTNKARCKYAFAVQVTLPFGPNAYVCQVIALHQSIRRSGAKYEDYDFVLLAGGNWTHEALATVEATGVVIRKIELLPTEHLHLKPHRRVKASRIMPKIRSWQLTEWERVMMLDVDQMVRPNKTIDHYFQFGEFYGRRGSRSPINAGFFVIEPSLTTFQDLLEIYCEGDWSRQLGWRKFGPFPHWFDENKMTDWNFIGSDIEQGLFWYYFKLVHKRFDMCITTWELYHFTGDSIKPWVTYHDSLATGRYWWGLMKEAEETNNIKAEGKFCFKTPPTKEQIYQLNHPTKRTNGLRLEIGRGPED